MSRTSFVSINRPNGIFPGGKVRHVPPPAVEASVSPEVAGVAGADGAGTGVAAAGAGGPSLSTNGGGVAALTAGAVADCCAIDDSSSAGSAVGMGEGKAPFFLFASFPFGVGVRFAAFSSLCGTLTIAGASTGFAFGTTVDAGVACAWIRWLAVKAREKIRNWRNMRVGEAGMRVSSRCRFERNTGAVLSRSTFCAREFLSGLTNDWQPSCCFVMRRSNCQGRSVEKRAPGSRHELRGIMKILLVEDHSESRQTLARLIERRGHEVVSVGTAEEAEKALASHGFAFLILDWMLPGKSGLDLCRELRGRPGGDEIFILLITARTETEDLERALAAVELRLEAIAPEHPDRLQPEARPGPHLLDQRAAALTRADQQQALR